MIQIKNLLFQPLTFPLKGGGSLHLQPRETRHLTDDLVSVDLETAAKRGLLQLQPVQAKPEPPVEKPKSTKRKRRTQA